MSPEKNKKEKITAISTVVLMFFVVGSLLFVISLNNKEKTELLKEKVLERQTENEAAKNLEKIQMSTSSESGITSKSFLTLAITIDGKRKILAQKNPDLAMPIASLTKLMVAVVMLENISPETEITASPNYIGLEESAFVLETDKTYKAHELLANMLISSDNDSARLLGSTLSEKKFIDKMNLKARELGLTQTKFANTTGLDPVTPTSEINISSATDLANLLIYIKNNHPDILRITANAWYDFCDINNYCKITTSTDRLLADKTLKFNILGGKTGSTNLAGKNLALVVEPAIGLFLINVVLGSNDNFADTVSLINNVRLEN